MTADNLTERLEEGCITSGSGYLFSVNEAATNYLMEQAADRIATLEARVEVEVELRKASYERITELEAGLLDALHVINGEFSHGPDDDLTIDEWLTDD